MSGAPLALAAHHLETGRPQQALDCLAGLPGDEALSPAALALRAAALLGLDRDEEARRVATRGLERDPESVGLLSLLAAACSALSDLPAAERALLAALRLDPENADLMADYAEVLAEDGQDAKAQRVLARAAQLDPDSGAVRQARAFASFARGDDRQAVADARRALAHDPASLQAHALLGASALARGEAGTALRASRTAAAGTVGDRDLADLAREARLSAHWSQVPLWPIARYGPVPVWFAGVALLLLTSRLLPPPLFGVVALLWLTFVVYSWVAPAALRAWARARW